MTSFVIVFFFAVTGWTLNHAERFSGPSSCARRHGTLDMKAWSAPGDAWPRPNVGGAIRRATGIHGAVTDFRVDDDQLTVTFKGPGYSADA